MEGNTFDTIARILAAGSTRRRMLGGLIGTTAAVLAGATALEAKPKGQAKGKNKNNGNGNGNGRGSGTEKVQICHRNHGKKGFKLITVGAPAAPAHERHGDTVCESQACNTVTGCEIAEDTGDLTCVLTPVEDNSASCELEGGGTGTCVGGECVAEDGGGTTG